MWFTLLKYLFVFFSFSCDLLYIIESYFALHHCLLYSIPLTLEWSASTPHDYIVAGCHDGTVIVLLFLIIYLLGFFFLYVKLPSRYVGEILEQVSCFCLIYIAFLMKMICPPHVLRLVWLPVIIVD